MNSSCNAFATRNDTLFGCENYEECHKLSHDEGKYEPSPFEKMMIMKSAQLSLFAYNLYRNSSVKSQEELEESGSLKFNDRINPVQSYADIIDYQTLNHSEYKSKGLVGVMKIKTGTDFRYVAVVSFRGTMEAHEWK